MKITIEMACSINGLIATKDGNEDFLSKRNWNIMLEFLKEQDVLIWGRKTFENVVSWGEKYIKDLKDINIVVISKSINSYPKFINVFCCDSLKKCIDLCKKKGFSKLFVSGGAMVNSSFVKKGLVDKIIINYNPYLLGKGIPLFNDDTFENELELIKVVNESDGIIQVHYKVLK